MSPENLQLLNTFTESAEAFFNIFEIFTYLSSFSSFLEIYKMILSIVVQHFLNFQKLEDSPINLQNVSEFADFDIFDLSNVK